MNKKQKNDFCKNLAIGVRRGAIQALKKHKREGWPIAVSQNGKVVLIPPEDIIIPDENVDSEN